MELSLINLLQLVLRTEQHLVQRHVGPLGRVPVFLGKKLPLVFQKGLDEAYLFCVREVEREHNVDSLQLELVVGRFLEVRCAVLTVLYKIRPIRSFSFVMIFVFIKLDRAWMTIFKCV
jgi:hypothetical protein